MILDAGLELVHSPVTWLDTCAIFTNETLIKITLFSELRKKITENNVNASGDTSMIGPCFAIRSIFHTLYFSTVLISQWNQHRSKWTFRLIKLCDVCIPPFSCLTTIQTISWTRQLLKDNNFINKIWSSWWFRQVRNIVFTLINKITMLFTNSELFALEMKWNLFIYSPSVDESFTLFQS